MKLWGRSHAELNKLRCSTTSQRTFKRVCEEMRQRDEEQVPLWVINADGSVYRVNPQDYSLCPR